MPTRGYKLDTGFSTGPMPVAYTAPQPEVDTFGQISDALTLLTAPVNPQLAVNVYNRYSTAFHAAFDLENDVVNTFDLLTRPVNPRDPNFDAMKAVKDAGLWDNYRDNFIGVQSAADFNDVYARIQKEDRAKQALMAAGPVGMVAVVAAGLASPTALLPFVGEERGFWALAKGLGWGFAGGLAQELPLQLAQETRTFEESAFSVGMSTVVGGVLGGAVGYLGKPLDEVARELDGRNTPGVRRPRVPASIGAEGLVKDARLTRDALGAEKIIGDQGPVGKLLGSPVVQNLMGDSPLIRYRTAQLSDAGLDVTGVPRGGTVENRIKVYDAPLAQSIRKLDEAYAEYFFDTAKPGAFSNMRASVQSLVARGNKLSKKEFAEQIAIAMESGDVHVIPQVAEVAQFARKTLLDPILKKAQDVKLFARLETDESGEVKVVGDLSYLNRDYNVEAISRRPTVFTKILQDHIEQILQEEFQGQLEKVVKKQAKDKALLNDIKRPFDEIQQLLNGFKSELKQMDEGRLGADKELDDLVQDLRSRARNKTLPKDVRDAAKQELKDIENSDDPFFVERKNRKKEIRQRLTNLNKAAAQYQVKQDGKLERINRLEELQFNSIDRAVRKGQKFFAKFDNLTDDEFDAQLEELKNQFEELGKQFDRTEERIGDLARGSDYVEPAEVQVDGGVITAKSGFGDQLAQFEFAQMNIADRMNRVSAQLEAVDSTDREAVRLLLREEYDAMIQHVQKLNSRRGARAQRLREQAAALDPAIVETRIKELESTIPDRAAEFRDQWRQRGVEGDVPSVPGVKADFSSTAAELAREIKEKITGQNVRLTGYDVLYEKRGPMLARMLNIPAAKLQDVDGTSFLDRDVEKLWAKYTRTMAPDIEVTRAFGELDVESGRPQAFLEINEEQQQALEALKTKLDEDFAEKYPKPTVAQKAAHQVNLDKQLKDLGAQYDLGRKNLEGILSRLRHTWGVPKDPAAFAGRAARTIMNLNVLRFMGGVGISSLPDVAQPIIRYGVGRVFRDGYLPLLKGFKAIQMTARELQLAGAALDIVLHSRANQIWDIGDYMVRGSKFEKAVDYASSKMGLIAMFDYWTVAMKQVAGSTAIAQTLDDVVQVVEGGTEQVAATQRLAKYGITGDMALLIRKEMMSAGGGEKIDGVWWPNTEAWKNQDAVDAFRAALVGQVNSTIITPGVERPLWTDSSVAMRLATQFKSFAFSSTTKTMMAGLQKRDVAVVMGTMISLALGALSYYIYAMTAGGAAQAKMQAALDDLDGEGWKVFADEAMARSGVEASLGLVQNMLAEIPLAAPYVTFSGQRTSRRGGQGITEAMLGPSFDTLAEAAGVLGDLKEPTQGTVNRATNLLPLQNHFLLRRAFDAIGEASGLPERRQ